MLLNVRIAIYQAKFVLAVGVLHSLLSDSGPHVANRWDESVRLRHLYTAKHGLHLQINGDGKVDGSVLQSSYSLLEIRPVDTGYVAIKGVTTSQYLCMEERGRLYGSHAYIKDDCSFLERILPNGYNIYLSDTHGAGVSLSGVRQRPALSQFLPMPSTLTRVPEGADQTDLRSPGNASQWPQWTVDTENMDPIGIVSQTAMQSPSLDKR